MRILSVFGCLLTLYLITGCSSVSVIPRPSTPGAVVNPSDKSIRVNNSGLTVSVRVQDTAVGGYDIETAIASFYLTLDNRTGSKVDIALDSFVLVDSNGSKLAPLPPEEVNALLNPQINMFLPIPFVGYLDVVALEQHRASAAMASEQPYVGEGLPAAEELIPLTTGPLNNLDQASGMLYFNIELINESRVELKADFHEESKGRKLSYSFPFSIEK